MTTIRKLSNKLADTFADERLNLITLAQQTALLFTPAMTAKVHQWLRLHSHFVNGHDTEKYEIDLDNLAGRE